MATNDTIADMLTRIRNATLARHQNTQVPSTRMTRSIAKVLKDEGFIVDFDSAGEGITQHLVIALKYKKNRQPAIKALKRISKPGLRVYANHKEVPKILGGIGISIISTSQGIMTDREARRQGVGGEVLCSVY